MPVLFLFSCESAFFSLLIGAYLNSALFGFALLGLSAIIMYALYQHFYRSIIFVWGGTILATLATFLWLSELDKWLGTGFFSIFLSIGMAILAYISNKLLFKNYKL
jgi:hypothetical protein